MLFQTLSVPTHKSANSSSICSFWHFNYIPFSTILCILNESTNEWISSSFSFPFSSILFAGREKTSHWQWHCEHHFYRWWWQLRLLTKLHQKPIYTYPFQMNPSSAFLLFFLFQILSRHDGVLTFFLIEVNVFRRKLRFHSTWIDYNGSSRSIDWQNISILSHSFNSYWNMFN